jgi:hypothetical protein
VPQPLRYKIRIESFHQQALSVLPSSISLSIKKEKIIRTFVRMAFQNATDLLVT